ncbi:hypothetical protein [Arthrobacter mobilis]|uniref:Uncharacterized protein n=1 Tax=Arthrobacter mobilis TaxID=2724944 RepID=A0A7X6K6J5_9MICC|nr:hypothetical protein [Arthrobacter mobilis]NKX55430.1 hypothetical protein [Arthrobacter mobilis]
MFSAALLGIAGVLAAAAGVQAILRMRAEEEEGRLDLLLAVPRTRIRWFAANLAVAALSTAAVAVAAGAAAATAAFPNAGSGYVLLSTGAALAHVPAALVVTGAATFVFAAAPRLAVPLGWGLLAAALVLGQFGELLRLPV